MSKLSRALVLLATAVLLTGCSAPALNDAAATSPARAESAIPSLGASASSGIPISTPTPTMAIFTYSLDCYDDEENDQIYPSYQDVWASGPAITGCDAGRVDGNTYSQAQVSAATKADYDIQDLGSLYEICGQLNYYDDLRDLSKEQIAELRGVLTVCPDRPDVAKLKSLLKHSQDVIEQEANGERFTDGTYRVGKDIKPGTYVIPDGVENCYWERQDKSGETIANNFIASAARVSVTIYQSDYGFYAEGCGTWVQQ